MDYPAGVRSVRSDRDVRNRCIHAIARLSTMSVRGPYCARVGGPAGASRLRADLDENANLAR